MLSKLFALIMCETFYVDDVFLHLFAPRSNSLFRKLSGESGISHGYESCEYQPSEVPDHVELNASTPQKARDGCHGIITGSEYLVPTHSISANLLT